MSKIKNQNWQKFLLTFFKGDFYEEKEVNGFWLVKSFSGNTGKWQISIYTHESFIKYKRFTEEGQQPDLSWIMRESQNDNN